VSGFSAKVWYTSSSSPHLAQRYSYVGIRRLPDFGLALSVAEC
jgi:hypothetical protein